MHNSLCTCLPAFNARNGIRQEVFHLDEQIIAVKNKNAHYGALLALFRDVKSKLDQLVVCFSTLISGGTPNPDLREI